MMFTIFSYSSLPIRFWPIKGKPPEKIKPLRKSFLGCFEGYLWIVICVLKIDKVAIVKIG